ncbi:unnamed protein product [Withania somnifera]
MAFSYHEENTCRDIVLYVPPNPAISSSQIVNDVETIIVPQQLTQRKSRLITTKVIASFSVNFIIVPSEGEANLYTIRPKKNEEESNDPHGLNRKYYGMLNGWKAEKRQRQNGIRETVGVVEKRSKKRNRESSISEREPVAKKHTSNGHGNYDKSEVEKFVADAWNNLMNRDNNDKGKDVGISRDPF